MDQFDKFIRKHSEKELELPTELNWDKMNIPLPNKENKKRKIFWYSLIPLCLSLCIGCSYFYFNKTQNQSNSSTLAENMIEVFESTLNTPQNQSIKESKKIESPLSENESIQIANELTSKNSKVKTISGLTTTMANNTLNSFPLTKSKTPRTTIQTDTLELGISKLQNVSVLPAELEAKSTFNLNSNSTQERDPVELYQMQSLSRIENSIAYIAPYPPIHFDEKFLLSNSKESEKLSLYFSLGHLKTHNHYSNGPQAEILNSAESAGHGISASLGSRLLLNNTFFLMSEFSYQKQRHFFMHTEVVSKNFDAILYRQVTTLRHVCHNNTLETLGLKVGIGKHFIFNENWGSTVSLAISSDYQLRADGRTLNDEVSIIELNNHKFPQKFIYNGHMSAGLFYNLKGIRLSGNIGWQQGLNSAVTSTQSNLEYSPRGLNVSLGVEKRF